MHGLGFSYDLDLVLYVLSLGRSVRMMVESKLSEDGHLTREGPFCNPKPNDLISFVMA